MYLVDANILIEAKNRYYAFDIAPGFWTWLERAHASAQVCSIDAVRDELLEGYDELADWARATPSFFRPVDQSAANNFSGLSRWAASRSYTPAALAGFTGNNADYLLVAYARGHANTVVTHEKPQPKAQRRVLIPDACEAMSVAYVDTFQMLRQTGAKLHLGS